MIGEVARYEFSPHIIRYSWLIRRHLMSRTVHSQEGETNTFKPGEVACSLISVEIGLPGGLHCVA